MNEPSTAPPGQAQPSTPPQGQQAPVQNAPANQPVVITGAEPPAPQPPAPAEPVSPEQFAQLQQQLQQREQQFQQAQESARHFQSQASRLQNTVASLVGQQPPAQPQDPLAPYVQQLTAKGYDAKSARDLAEMQYQMTQQAVQPLQQQLQQSQVALQASTQIDPIMQQVYAQRPDLFTNPAVYAETREAMLAQARHGGSFDVEQAGMTAAALAFRASLQQPPQPPPFQQWQPNVVPMPQPIPQPFARGMTPVHPNFQQPNQPAPIQMTPQEAQIDAEIKARYPKQA